MSEIGLIPSNTGEPGGKMTGQMMTHYINEGGAFALVCADFLATGTAVLYQDRAGEGEEKIRKRKAASKTKYTCSACGLNAWAKPEVNLISGDCEQEMEADPVEEN